MKLRSGRNKATISCKSGSEWGDIDLNFFRIVVSQVTSFNDFFMQAKPSKFTNEEVNEFLAQDLSNVIVQQDIDWKSIKYKSVKTVIKDMIAVTRTHRSEESVKTVIKDMIAVTRTHRSEESVKTVIKDMIAVTRTHRSEESAVDDLAKSVLQLFEYDADSYAIRTREALYLEMANSKTQATPDICIESADLSIKLLEDKSYNVGNDRFLMNPEAQLIAEALAAFQENVRIYRRLGIISTVFNQKIPGC